MSNNGEVTAELTPEKATLVLQLARQEQVKQFVDELDALLRRGVCTLVPELVIRGNVARQRIIIVDSQTGAYVGELASQL